MIRFAELVDTLLPPVILKCSNQDSEFYAFSSIEKETQGPALGE